MRSEFLFLLKMLSVAEWLWQIANFRGKWRRYDRRSDDEHLNNCLFWEQKRWFWLTRNGWMITPASLDEDTEPRRPEKGSSEWESEETGEEEVWTIAFSQKECDHFCLSSHSSLMYSHESIANADSESPKWRFKFRTDCNIIGNLLFYIALLLMFSQ